MIYQGFYLATEKHLIIPSNQNKIRNCQLILYIYIEGTCQLLKIKVQESE